MWSYKLCLDLVSWLGPRTELHLRMLPPNRPGWVVSWAMAGEPAPAWLDVARELVERWVHQQQIRLATNRPTLTDPHLARLVLDTMMRALPATFQGIDAPAGTEVHVVAGEPIDRHWAVASTGTGWSMVKRGRHPAAVVHADPDLLWRRAVRMTGRADALSMSRLEGDRVSQTAFSICGALSWPGSDPSRRAGFLRRPRGAHRSHSSLHLTPGTRPRWRCHRASQSASEGYSQ